MGTQYRREQDKRPPKEKDEAKERRAQQERDSTGTATDDLGFPPDDESRFG